MARGLVALEDGLGLQVVLGHPALDAAEAERILVSHAGAMTATDELQAHYDLSQTTTGLVMYRTQVWAPLEGVLRGDGTTQFRWQRDGLDLLLPAIDVEGNVVWGLTYRMLELMREVMP